MSSGEDTKAGWGKPQAQEGDHGRRGLRGDADPRAEHPVRDGHGANYGQPAAGKTGTTEEHSDAWFCGYTPRLGTTVWVGYPKGKIPMENVHGISVAGGTFPAQIWRLFMSSAIGGLEPVSFPEPTDWPEWTDVRARDGRSLVRLRHDDDDTRRRVDPRDRLRTKTAPAEPSGRGDREPPRRPPAQSLPPPTPPPSAAPADRSPGVADTAARAPGAPRSWRPWRPRSSSPAASRARGSRERRSSRRRRAARTAARPGAGLPRLPRRRLPRLSRRAGAAAPSPAGAAHRARCRVRDPAGAARGAAVALHRRLDVLGVRPDRSRARRQPVCGYAGRVPGRSLVRVRRCGLARHDLRLRAGVHAALGGGRARLRLVGRRGGVDLQGARGGRRAGVRRSSRRVWRATGRWRPRSSAGTHCSRSTSPAAATTTRC